MSHRKRRLGARQIGSEPPGSGIRHSRFHQQIRFLQVVAGAQDDIPCAGLVCATGPARQARAQRIGLQVHNSATIVQQLLRFELDLGLIEGSCRDPELIVEPWVEDELVVFCAPGHPLARGEPVDLPELAAQDWILRETGSGTRETFDQALRHFYGHLNVRLELEHTEAIKRAVESGLGVGCISRLALREAIRRGSLVAVETPELDLRRQFQFVTHRRKYVTAGMREFIDLCRRMTAGAARSDLIELPFIP